MSIFYLVTIEELLLCCTIPYIPISYRKKKIFPQGKTICSCFLCDTGMHWFGQCEGNLVQHSEPFWLCSLGWQMTMKSNLFGMSVGVEEMPVNVCWRNEGINEWHITKTVIPGPWSRLAASQPLFLNVTFLLLFSGFAYYCRLKLFVVSLGAGPQWQNGSGASAKTGTSQYCGTKTHVVKWMTSCVHLLIHMFFHLSHLYRGPVCARDWFKGREYIVNKSKLLPSRSCHCKVTKEKRKKIFLPGKTICSFFLCVCLRETDSNKTWLVQ